MEVRAGGCSSEAGNCVRFGQQGKRQQPQTLAMRLFDGTKIPVLNRALDAYALRQKVIAGNLANITTPGYKAQTVKFEEELSGALQSTSIPGMTTDARHIPIGGSSVTNVTPTVETPRSGEETDPRASGMNNVDLDQEMAELAKTQLRFKFAARLIGDTFRGIQKSIRGTV
jgi:flagellar basal-body rod protein FlgB